MNVNAIRIPLSGLIIKSLRLFFAVFIISLGTATPGAHADIFEGVGELFGHASRNINFTINDLPNQEGNICMRLSGAALNQVIPDLEEEAKVAADKNVEQFSCLNAIKVGEISFGSNYDFNICGVSKSQFGNSDITPTSNRSYFIGNAWKIALCEPMSQHTCNPIHQFVVSHALTRNLDVAGCTEPAEQWHEHYGVLRSISNESIIQYGKRVCAEADSEYVDYVINHQSFSLQKCHSQSMLGETNSKFSISSTFKIKCSRAIQCGIS